MCKIDIWSNVYAVFLSINVIYFHLLQYLFLFVDVFNQPIHAIKVMLGLWSLRPLSTIFQLYRGCRKLLTNFITLLYRVHLAMNGVHAIKGN
jgi:hypothetical protein